MKNCFCDWPVAGYIWFPDGGVTDVYLEIDTAVVDGGINWGGYGFEPGGACDAWGIKNCCVCLFAEVWGVVFA